MPIRLGKIALTEDSTGADEAGASLTIEHANPTLTITSRNNDNFENETLHKIGQTTGWSYGDVEDTCDDVQFKDQDGIVRQCSDRVDYASNGGDSGAPVFYLKADGTAELRGVHFGRVGGLYEDGMMSDLGRIEMDLGPLTVIQTGTVSAEIMGPGSVPPNAFCEWSVDVEPGDPPYQYEWRRDGSVVSTSTSYSTNNTGGADFQLTIEVTDDRDDTAFDARAITIDQTRAGELIC
ncbi:MAG: hypothetical protein ACREQV_08025 [Candidatus Binatia bacterium]